MHCDHTDVSPTLSVDLGQALHGLANALDLVGVDDLGHGKRVALMAHVCALADGLPGEAHRTLVYAALVHDCGVSSTRIHQCLVVEQDWAGVHTHCESGARLIGAFPPLAAQASIVRHHHTPWHDLQHSALDEPQREAANLIFLCDRLDHLVAADGGHADQAARRRALAELHRAERGRFAPYLLERLEEVAQIAAFWDPLLPEHLDEATRLVLEGFPPSRLDPTDLFRLARIAAHVVDAKSRFTAGHSLGVAALARLLGQSLGLRPARLDEVELAALLHDVGKLRVPDEILEKRGGLDAIEARIVRRHASDTRRALAPVAGLERIAHWAGAHHERIDGHGYPAGLCGEGLGLEARILAVADMFQALAQRRPYRAPLSNPAILGILAREAACGRLDRGVVEAVRAAPEACRRAATLAEEYGAAAVPA